MKKAKASVIGLYRISRFKQTWWTLRQVKTDKAEKNAMIIKMTGSFFIL